MRPTLPWRHYTDPTTLDRERERIFRRTWQYAGHLGQLPDGGPGTFASRAGDIPVVVTRDEHGNLRALLNVCRHRGSVLVDGEGARGTIQCPYHAWTYGLDGRLLRAPRAEREPGFDASERGLVRLAVGTWGPLVFVNPDEDAPPLAETLGPAPRVVADTGIDVDGLRFHHRATSSVEANWKIVCENYLECYHCAVAHPGFSALVDVRPDRYELDVAAPGVLVQHGPVRRDGTAPFDVRGEVERSLFVFVWPNLVLNVMPGRGNLSAGAVLPDGPTRTSRFLDYFFAPDADPRWIGELLRWDDEVGAEDAALVRRVQTGVATAGLAGGTLLDSSEQLVARFDALVAAALATPSAQGV